MAEEVVMVVQENAKDAHKGDRCKMEFDIADIDNIINDYILKQTKMFYEKDIVKHFLSKFDINEDELKSEVSFILKNNPLLFENEGSFLRRNQFFKDAKFAITPTKEEIEKGILFVGGRFATFCNQDVFTTDISLVNIENNENVSYRNICIPIENAAYYYSLLGSEEMLENFIAESQINATIIADGNPNKEITLAVLDFEKFYNSSNFTLGDSLIVTVDDWFNGKYSFDIAPKNIINKNQKKWMSILDKSLNQVFDRFDRYIEVPEQLSYAFFISDKWIKKNPVVSLEYYINNSDEIEMTFSDNRTILWRKGNTNNEDNIPEDISISQGETKSLDDILKDIKSPLNTAEIEAYMRDTLFQNQKYFDEFYERCFLKNKLNFIDDAQSATCMNFLEDMWESIIETYDPNADIDKGTIRTRILEIFDDRLDAMALLQDNESSLKSFSQDKIQELSEITLKLSSFLQMLNTHERFQEDQSVEDILALLDDISDKQELLFND